MRIFSNLTISIALLVPVGAGGLSAVGFIDPEIEARAAHYIDKGIELSALGDYKGAIFDFTEAIRINPRSFEAHVARGRARMGQKNLDGALYDFTDAIELNSKYAEAFYWRAVASVGKEDTDGALEDFTRAIELNPSRLNYFIDRGDLRFKLEDFKGAAEDYDRVVIHDRGSSEALLKRSRATFYGGDVEAASRDLSRILRRDSEYSPAYMLRADIRSGMGQYRSALNDYRLAIKLNPIDPGVVFGRGLLHYGRGNLQLAREDIERGVRLAREDETRDYGAIWIWMIEARLEKKSPQPNARLARYLKKRGPVKEGDWLDSLLRYAIGELPEETLFDYARNEDPEAVDERLCEAFFYSAQKRFATGQARKAIPLLNQCVETRVLRFYEYKTAKIQLAHLHQ